MSARNGYFQINITERVTFVRLFPPVDGGQPIIVEELRDYLSDRGYQLDVVFLKKVIDSLGEDTKDLKIADKKGIPESESFKVIISPDKMTAIARFYPFSSAGAALTMEDIKNELNFRGVKRGIDEKEISRFLSDKHYCTDYCVATGSAPIEGKDAVIDYFFNTNPSLKPKLNEDGSVDFFSIGAISKVDKGQKLATLTPEEEGMPGYNVCGEVLMPRKVLSLKLKHGRNIEASEDNRTLISLVDGHASLVDGQVFVTDVYQVSDVDTSTGNIEYPGSVLVLGNVKAGFTVKAEGNVEVRGVVEGALIEATGNVTIARGMNGMGKGAIICGGNVVAKFLENTTVHCDGYVHSEAILSSKIASKGNVDVTGRKGFITGGVVRSEGIVSARSIGSSMGAATEIEVGIDPKIKLKFNSIGAKLATDRKRFEQIEQVVGAVTKKIKSGDKLSPEQVKYFKTLTDEYSTLKKEIDANNAEYMDLMDLMEGVGNDSYVKVDEFAYPGTKISISDVMTTLDKPVQHGRFVKDGADVRVRGY